MDWRRRARRVQYAVFGCGNRNWASTIRLFRASSTSGWRLRRNAAVRARRRRRPRRPRRPVPRVALALVAIRREGPRHLVRREGRDDAGRATRSRSSPGRRPTRWRQCTARARCRCCWNRELQTSGERSTRHIEMRSPRHDVRSAIISGVVAENPPSVVARCAALRFRRRHLRAAAPVSPLSSTLPVDTPVALGRLLAHHVELQHTATASRSARMAEHTQCPNTKRGCSRSRPTTKKPAPTAPGEAQTPLGARSARRESGLRAALRSVPGHASADDAALLLDSSSPLASPDRCSITVGVCAKRRGGERHVRRRLLDVPRPAQRRRNGRRVREGFEERLPPAGRSGDADHHDGPGTGLAPFADSCRKRCSAARGQSPWAALLFFRLPSPRSGLPVPRRARAVRLRRDR